MLGFLLVFVILPRHKTKLSDRHVLPFCDLLYTQLRARLVRSGAYIVIVFRFK